MIESLTDTSWRLVTIEGEPAVSSTETTLTFQADRIAGTGGVNRFNGGWAVTGGELRMSRIAATRMMGPPEAQEQEDRFLAILEAVTAFTCDEDRLTLLQDGRPVLHFERMP